MDHLTNLRIFRDVEIAEDGNAYFDLDQVRFSPDGFYTIFLTLEDVPDPEAEPAANFPQATLKLEWLASNNGGVDYLLAEADGSESAIADSLVSDGGPGSDGKYLFTFDPYVTTKIRFRLTETGSVADSRVKVNGWLCIQ
jgi:hypothetical protein